ncbi:MAG: nickel-binding protein [Nitrososphaera sp.]|jgi:two-component system sensor histidine kinase HydH
MPIFMDGHHMNKDYLEIIKNSINNDENWFGVSIFELYYNQKTCQLHCIMEAPNEDAVLNHHERLGIKCDFVHQLERIRTKNSANNERLVAIGELASRLAHDLRNPLSVIKNTVEIMESKPKLRIEDRVIHYGRLHRAIDRISHQIEDVLDFVRPLSLSFENCLLNEIISSAIEKITLPDSVRINMPQNFVYLVCDPIKLEIVFTNLIVNAIQAMDNAGQIDIKIFDGNDFVTIQITDTGHGIAENVLPKVFEPLFTTKQTGTGLGLASCKKIIEQHNGTINVSSTEGVGTTFRLYLPKKQLVSNVQNDLISAQN